MTAIPPPAANRRDAAQVHEDMPRVLEEFLESRDWTWRGLERGDYPIPTPPGIGDATPLQALQWFLILRDPVLFIECNYRERPENGGGMWRLFDYQKPALRYRGDLIYSCAAGTGKSRDIVGKMGWGGVVRRGPILIVGNMEGTIDEIWRTFAWLCEQNPFLRAQFPRDGMKQRPRRLIQARNGNHILFLPTGADGESLRGQHISNYLLFDEADRCTNPEIWNELYRAIEPGCEVSVYSVLIGRTDTPFYKIRQKAVPLAKAKAEAMQRQAAIGAQAADAIKWARVHWRKDQMPAPYWSAERKAMFIDRYGGEHTSGYRRNVLGELGEPQEAIFDRTQLAASRDAQMPYRLVRITLDRSAGEAKVEASINDPTYQAGPEPLTPILDQQIVIGALDLDALLRSQIRPTTGHWCLGVDFGQSPDPTEISCGLVVGDRVEIRYRIQLLGVDYEDQEDVIASTLHSIFAPTFGIGVDAGGAGTAPSASIRRKLPSPDDITCLVFNRAVPVVDFETGETVLDDKGRERTWSTKEMASDLLVRSVQRYRLRTSHDPERRQQYENCTIEISKTGRRTYPGKPDHILDADRCLIMRYWLMETGRSAPTEIEFETVPYRAGRLGDQLGYHPGELGQMRAAVASEAGRPTRHGGGW